MTHSDFAEKRANDACKKGAFDQAINILMDEYGEEIFRFCVSIVGNSDDGKDVLQTSFMKAYENLGSFKSNSSYRTWLYSIARNQSLDRVKMDRRFRDRISVTSDAPEIIDEHNPHDDRETDALTYCLEKLRPEIRSAVLLRFQSELSYAEISTITLDKAGTLQAKVVRALPVLKLCLEQQGVIR